MDLQKLPIKKERCQYVFTKGRTEGQQCPENEYCAGSQLCRKHLKQLGLWDPNYDVNVANNQLNLQPYGPQPQYSQPQYSQPQTSTNTAAVIPKAEELPTVVKSTNYEQIIKAIPPPPPSQNTEVMAVQLAEPQFLEEIEEKKSEMPKVKPASPPKEATQVEPELTEEEYAAYAEAGIEPPSKEDEPVEHGEVTQHMTAAEKKIQDYYLDLPFLSEVLPLDQRKGASAEEWLERIEERCSSLISDDLILKGAARVTGAVELIGTRRGYKLQGYSRVCMSDPTVVGSIKMLKVKYLSDITKKLGPEWMLVIGLANAAAVVVGANEEAARNGTATL